MGAFISVCRSREYAIGLSDYAGFGRTPVLVVAEPLSLRTSPFAGFIAKWYVFRCDSGGGYWLAIIGMLTSVVSAFYFSRIIAMMYDAG